MAYLNPGEGRVDAKKATTDFEGEKASLISSPETQNVMENYAHQSLGYDDDDVVVVVVVILIVWSLY